jgi:hypothetical protein
MQALNRWHLAVLGLAGPQAFSPARARRQPPPPEHPTIEPGAVDRLKATSARLAGAKSMSFTAVTAYVSPARNGEPMYYSTLSAVELRQPDKLRVVTPGGGPRRIT